MTQTAIKKEELLAHVVRQKVLQRPLAQVLLSKVFALAEPWESDSLCAAADVRKITSLQALTDSLAGENRHSLLVTADSGVTLAELSALLESAGRPVTIFMETYEQ